jgi:hypothetical protein
MDYIAELDKTLEENLKAEQAKELAEKDDKKPLKDKPRKNKSLAA